MIYIDPPYNTGSDSFIYPDKFSETREEYARRVGDKDSDGYLKRDGVFQGAWRKNPRENGHYHSNWLSMMLPRLHLARTLLREDGVIFISIDDNEQAQLKLLCDEVFGAENFVDTLIVMKSSNGMGSKEGFSTNHDFVLVYKKNSTTGSFYGITASEDYIANFDKEDEFGKFKIDGLFRKKGRSARKEDSPNCFYPLFFEPKTGKVFLENTGNLLSVTPKLPNGNDGRWIWSKDFAKDKMYRLHAGKKGTIYVKDYYTSGVKEKPRSILTDTSYSTESATNEIINIFGEKLFSTPKPIQLITDLIDLCTNQDDIILDFFSGSSATAHATFTLNSKDTSKKRRCICVQLPEEINPKNDEVSKAAYDFCQSLGVPTNIAEIAKERIRRAGAAISGSLKEGQSVDTGFKVFKLAESHFKQWQNPLAGSLNVQAREALFQEFQDVVKPDASIENMAYELMLRLGFQLTDPISFSGCLVWLSKADGSRKTVLLLADASQNRLDEIVNGQPVKVFALDKAFGGNDALKANFALQLKDAGIALETL